MKRLHLLRLPGLVFVSSTILAAGVHAQEQGAVPIQADTWVRWIGWVFVVMALGGLLVFWINLRLQGQIALQTRALRASETRMRNLFENTPVAIVEEDFSAVAAWLQDLRRQGVADLAVHFAAHPSLAAEKFGLVRVVAASRMAAASSRGPASSMSRMASVTTAPERADGRGAMFNGFPCVGCTGAAHRRAGNYAAPSCRADRRPRGGSTANGAASGPVRIGAAPIGKKGVQRSPKKDRTATTTTTRPTI